MILNSTATLLDIFQAITPNSSESDVEKKVVVPLLLTLGYSSTDWRSQVVILKSKLDFLVGHSNSALLTPPYLIIEVKAPRKSIAHSGWQINNYMRQTGSVLGLLTNGYDFHILYNFDKRITKIVAYSQETLIHEYKLFHKILSKKTYLHFTSTLYTNQQKIRLHFLNLIIQAVQQEDMFSLFNKRKATTQRQVTSEEILELETKEKHQSMIITIFNNKGGVGKTTTTINLAAALSKLAQRVLLIDIDAQANLTTGLGIDPFENVEKQGKKDISHLLTEPRTRLEDTVISKQWDDVGLDIVPSHIRLSEMEASLIMTPDIDRVLAKKLKKSDYEYDYVLIDPPPSFGKANTISLMASSAVLIPTQFAPYPIRALEYVINRTIAIHQSRDEPLPILGIAVSMYDRSASKLTATMTQQIFDILAKNPESKNVELFPQNTWVPRLNIVSNTSGKGYPLSFAEFDDNLSVRDKETAQDAFSSYMELAKHLISITYKDKGVIK